MTATETVLKDVVPPTLTLTTPAAITLSNQRSYSVSGTCSGVDQPIQVGIGTLNFNTNCLTSNWTLVNKDVSAFTASSLTITADTTDLAGNPATQASANVVRDVLAPSLDGEHRRSQYQCRESGNLYPGGKLRGDSECHHHHRQFARSDCALL